MPEALVIPGLVAIDPGLWDGVGPAELLRGPLAGKAALPELEDWKQELWLLPREVAARHGARLPDAQIDPTRHPRTAAWLGEARLVVVDEQIATRAQKAGETALYLAYHRVSSGGGLELHGPDGARGFSSEDPPLLRVALQLDEDDEDEPEDEPPIARVYDRVLRALSGGAWSMLDVDLADTARRIPASEYDSHERELGEIAAMAGARRAEAEALLAALDATTEDTITLPGGYRARRVREPAFTLRADGDVSVTGPPIPVPADQRWIFEDVAAFTPAERGARRLRLLQDLRAGRVPGKGVSPRLILVAAALLVLALIVAALLR